MGRAGHGSEHEGLCAPAAFLAAVEACGHHAGGVSHEEVLGAQFPREIAHGAVSKRARRAVHAEQTRVLPGGCRVLGDLFFGKIEIVLIEKGLECLGQRVSRAERRAGASRKAS